VETQRWRSRIDMLDEGRRTGLHGGRQRDDRDRRTGQGTGRGGGWARPAGDLIYNALASVCLSVECRLAGRAVFLRRRSVRPPSSLPPPLLSRAVPKAQIPPCRLPVTSATSLRQTCDVPSGPNFITPTSPKLPRTGKFQESRRYGIWAKGDVASLSRTSRGCRHGGIWL